MECMDRPITAAVLPNPAATANIRTQRMDGIARMKATMPLIDVRHAFGGEVPGAEQAEEQGDDGR